MKMQELQNALNNINQNTLSQLDLSKEYIDHKQASLLANALQHNQSLTNLDLRNNKVSETGAKALANALLHNQSLTFLNLWKNQVGEAGATALANALLHNQSLSNLDLSFNQVGEAGTTALANTLQHNQSLTKLDLSSNQVGKAGTTALAKALQHNQSLTKLDLRNNKVGETGARVLANALLSNQSLLKLDLSSNQVDEAGARALANALLNNQSLTKLDLRNNKVGETGADALAKALLHNQSLTSLYLYNNQVGKAGVRALANALQHNQSLTKIDLSRNQMGDAGARALANALQHNHSLTSLYLYNNQVGKEATRSFNEDWEAHQNRCQLIQKTATTEDEQALITYFNKYQQFPPAVLTLLIQHDHQNLIMRWETYWSIAALNYQDRKGNTPLHYAIQLQANNLIAWLLTKPVSLTRYNNNLQSPATLLESANLLNSIVSYLLATRYFLGEGIKVDKIKARHYYEKASKEGHQVAAWLFSLLNLLDEKAYIESMAIDTLIVINEPLPKLTFEETQTVMLSIANFEGKLLPTLTQQDYTFYHLAAYLGSLEWLEASQTVCSSPTSHLSTQLILMKNHQGLRPSELARQQVKLIAKNKGIQLSKPEAEKDQVLVRYRACELALEALEEKATLNLLKDLLAKNDSLMLLESQIIQLINLNPKEIKSLLKLITTSKYRLVSSLTAQDYTLYHLCALLGSMSWFEAVQIFTSSSEENLFFFFELILAKTSPDGLRPSDLAQQQKHLIAQEKGFALDAFEAMLDETFQRYQTCELALREKERKIQLDLMKTFLKGEIIVESSIMELALLNNEEIKALIEVIATPEGKLISSLTTIPTLYHLCALLGSMNWFKELPLLVEISTEALNNSASLILASSTGLRSSETARQQADFIAKQKGFDLNSLDTVHDIVLQRYQNCELALREIEKKAYVALLTEFLKGENKIESMVTQLATLNPQEIKELVIMIINPEDKLSSFFSLQEYTPYHLAADLGSPNWCQALQALSASITYLAPDLVLVKNQQGFSPSALAKQQRKFIAEDKGIKLNTLEVDQNEVLVRYKACEIALRQIEEKVLLNLFLAEQRNQQQVHLNYEGRSRALKENIDLLSWQPENVSQALIIPYAQILLEIWSAKQTCINLNNQFKGQLKWPEKFDLFSIASPGQMLNQLIENSSSSRLKLQYKIQGSIIYIHYQYECAVQWLKFYESKINADFNTEEAYRESQAALKKLTKAYQNYESLWKKAATIDDKQWLRSTPTLLLQTGKTPSFITPLIAKGKTLSPATKLSYFLNKGEKIEDMVGAGTAPVFSIRGVHYKRNPHAPGVEFMVSSLGKVLAGEGATPTELLKVIGTDGIPYVYQASHTVQGKDLQSLLLNHPKYIDKIRADNFAAVVVLGILTDPQDGKPDNYMVEFSQDEQGKITQIDILGIDNDIAFSDVVFSQHKTDGKTDKYIMNIKNALYFFPQMMQPIENSFRDKLLKKQPEFILLEWLKLLLAKNKEYENLLMEGIFTLAEYAGDGLANKRGLQLPIKVVPGTIARVYRKLKQLHATLTQQPNITLWDLLMVIEPEVAIHYAKVKAKYPHELFGCDVMKCITALYEENVTNGQELMWLRNQLDKGYTHAMTTVVLKTAEEFGFEDNRTTSLKESVISLLKCLTYENFKGRLASVLYEQLSQLIKASELEEMLLLTNALAHNCIKCVYWLWQESVIEISVIQQSCENLKKYSLLHFFAQNKHLEGVKLLLAERVYSVNVCNSQGYTALHMAASVGDGAIVEYLVENKAYLKAKTTLGKTPLMMAESRCKQMNKQSSLTGDKKYADIIAYLKKAESSFQKQNNNQRNFLQSNGSASTDSSSSTTQLELKKHP